MNIEKDSLWIGSLIKERIEEIVPVYPCVASEGAPAEFCVYTRVGYQGRDSKDGSNYQESLNLMLNIAAPTYIKSVELAQRVKERLDHLRGAWEGKFVDYMTMTNATENYTGEEYVQTLYFTLTLDTRYKP